MRDVEDEAREARAAARRSRVVLRKTQLGAPDVDLSPVRGAEAITLATKLTRQAWSLTGQAWPTYGRSETPFRFVPRRTE